mgnify:FL=1
MDAEKEKKYTEIIKAELRTAMGCTEPIAIAYCASLAARALNLMPERIRIRCSGNVIKNAKAVTVPQTGGLIGIEAAAVAGIVGGDPDRELEVLADMKPEALQTIREILSSKAVEVECMDEGHSLQVIVDLYAGSSHAQACLADTHTGIYHIECDGSVLLDKPFCEAARCELDYDSLNIRDILAYADAVDLRQVEGVLDKEIACNRAISQEGLKNDWGQSVGRTMMRASGSFERTRLIAWAAAGSDARMNGCAMPVVINSGSGNQGMAASCPLLAYSQEHDVSKEKLMRALLVSNLIAIRQKRDIGRLSAFCGAVSAAVGAACGIAYLEGADYEKICRIITNSIATVGGMVCDGAKSSCAAKIAVALQSAFLAADMADRDFVFRCGEGLVKRNVEQTITTIGRMASEGMRATDRKVLDLMLEK